MKKKTQHTKDRKLGGFADKYIPKLDDIVKRERDLRLWLEVALRRIEDILILMDDELFNVDGNNIYDEFTLFKKRTSLFKN